MALNSKELVETVEPLPHQLRSRFDTPGRESSWASEELQARSSVDALGRDQSFLASPSPTPGVVARTASGRRPDAEALRHGDTCHFDRLHLSCSHKADTLAEKDLLRVLDWSQEPDALYDGLDAGAGIQPERAFPTSFSMPCRTFGVYRELTPVSSRSLLDWRKLYNIIQQSI